jgi:hypothetical protein
VFASFTLSSSSVANQSSYKMIFIIRSERRLFYTFAIVEKNDQDGATLKGILDSIRFKDN